MVWHWSAFLALWLSEIFGRFYNDGFGFSLHLTWVLLLICVLIIARGLTTLSLVQVCSLCSMAVLNIWVVWQWRVWLFSPFDLSVVNNLCPDHLFCCTHLHCTTGHYLTPAWPHFCLRNLSNFLSTKPPRQLLKFPLLSTQKCHSAGGKGGPHIFYLIGIIIFC